MANGIALSVCICLLFPAHPKAISVIEAPVSLSSTERRLAALLLLTLGLWMTDTIHGIQPAWIGLAAACVCLLPRVGFLSGDDFASGVNIRTCLYVAGILGLASLVARSGLGEVLGRALLGVIPLDPARPALGFGSVVGITALLNFVVTANGVPALFTPLAHALADGTGLPLLTVLMIQVIGYATPLLPYQAAPIVVAMGMGDVPARDGVRLCLVLAVVTFVVLVPLDYLWFAPLGRL
ncbi:MAG TPA: SLC13 family permease [Telmatospirillum sp.]|nr:SLC13 family permease [Telmatospirillum sp.]